MNRRDVAKAAVVALAACPATAKLVSAAPSKRQGPTIGSLINLAEHGSDSEYYGRLLKKALRYHSVIAVPQDNKVRIYWDSLNVFLACRNGHFDAAGPETLVSELLLEHYKPAQRGSDFPAGIPFRKLT
jgi:hypothetical protein